MPQEMALHLTNTIDEELFFYGRLANMPRQKIQQRCQFLTNLLELSNRRKIINKLSGGQQRRVSFAIALLHEPRLLILGIISSSFFFLSNFCYLDEPTVGVDPLLRKK
jgi:ABC-type multidrug transport system ATPase subunit